MVNTDIIIISYKDELELKRCIESIEQYAHNYNIIIEDNNKTNRGFTKAINDGIKKGSAEFIWLINSDAILLEGAQEALIKRFSYNDKVGIVGSMQIDYENRDMIRHGGTVRAFPAGAHKGGYISMGHCRFPEKATWINFASAMFRRKMVEYIGLMDENMFLLYSDSDYCYWARYRGWEVWYEPESKVVHRLNASRNVTEWHKKDMQAFMEKWGITADGYQSKLFKKLDKYP